MSNSDLIDQIRAAGLDTPETLTLMVTDGCNLYCRHCWLDCHSLKDAAPVPASSIMRVVDDFTHVGGTIVNLTGGEILSHPDWQPILAFCLNHASIAAICLQTNATLINRRHVDAWQEMPPEKLTIQVSLDGACARTHDLIRGSGSYDQALAGLRLLVETGWGPRTQVAFTETAHNINELPQLLEMVDRMGLARLVSGTLVKGGRAATSAHVSLPTPAHYRQLLERYQTDTLFHKRCDRKASIAAIEWFKNRSGATAVDSCGCLKNLFVDARGRLYPCTMLLLERYAAQSVYSRPLNQVIQEALARWRELPLLHRKRTDALASCASCTGQAHCRGGCMGRAATTRGDLMVPEDRCGLRKVVYNWGPSEDKFQ